MYPGHKQFHRIEKAGVITAV